MDPVSVVRTYHERISQTREPDWSLWVKRPNIVYQNKRKEAHLRFIDGAWRIKRIRSVPEDGPDFDADAYLD